MLSIAYSANIGGLGTKIGTFPNAILAGYVSKTYHIDISFLDYLKMGLPVVFILLPIAWMILRLSQGSERFSVHLARDAINRELKSLGKIKMEERLVLIYFALAALLWIFGRPIGKMIGLSEQYDALVAMVISLCMYLTPVRGESFLIGRHALTKISWGMLLFLGGSFAIAQAIQTSRLSDLISTKFQMIGPINLYMLFLMITSTTVLMSAFTSNTATSNVMLYVIGVIPPRFNLHPVPLLSAVTISSSCDFMLPCGTPPNAIVFGTGHVKMSNMIKIGFALDVISSLVVSIWCYTFIRFLYS